MGRQATDPLVRYQTKVDKRGPNECWPWTAARFERGYGAFRLGNRQLKAHRFGYEQLMGRIPDGVIVCHTCDNPPCQNPTHWFLGTHRDNALDRESKGRGRYGHTGPIVRIKPGKARGEQHGRAALDADKVRTIRAMHSAGTSQQVIGHTFGVSQEAVSRVVRRVTWAHVD